MWGGEYITYDRGLLYDQVWEKPLREVAKTYGVSDVYLGKICRQLNVPLPGRGYWAKIRAGKKPRRIKLPKARKDAKAQIVAWHRTQQVRKKLVEPGEAKLTLSRRIVVADELADPHKLVARAERRMRNKKPTNGAVAGRSLGVLDITVSPEALDRALRITDALLKGMAEAGLKVAVTGPEVSHRDLYGRTIIDQPGHLTQVICQDETIDFCLRETIKRTEDPKPEPRKRVTSWGEYTPWQPTTYTYTPTGQLSLQLTSVARLGVRQTWSDGKKQRLEDCLEGFVAQLGVVAQAIKVDRARREAEAREWAEQQRRAEEERERRRIERERLEKIVAEADAWHQAERLRAYAREALRRLNMGGLSSDQKVRRREDIERLLNYADRLDPIEGPDKPTDAA
jgi:hypothetical protein